MPSRRVVAISPDKTFAKRLVQALKSAGCSVESHDTIAGLGKGPIEAALLVLHLEAAMASALPALGERLADGGQIIAVLPKASVKDSVAAMQATPRLAGVMVAEELDSDELGAMATRIVFGDIFGVEKVVPWGTRIYSALVGDYQEKSKAIAEISAFADSMGVRRKYREAIEQCVDEMLMNALYDAPVDAKGKPLFADVPTKTRISLRLEQKAVVQYAASADLFVVSVRDPYGTLDRATVLRYLHKCLHSEQQIDRKTGGAGLGLYIMANAATTFFFNVLPGVATECICAFDLDGPKGQLEHFGFFNEKIDASGRLVAGASRLAPSGAKHPVERRAAGASGRATGGASRGVIVALSAAVALMVALVVMVGYPRLTAHPTGAVRVTTIPDGARIDVEGRSRGTSSGGAFTVEGLELGRAYRVSASRDGWNPIEAVVEPSGDVTDITLELEAREAVAQVDSVPVGASVLVDGRELGKTPLAISTLPPEREVELLFRKAGFEDLVHTVRIPAAGRETTVSVALVMSADVVMARLETEPPGAQVLLDDQPLPGLTTPVAEYIVAADKLHRFTFTLAGYVPATVSITPARGTRTVPVRAKLIRGGTLVVTANIDGTATVAGVAACSRRALPLRCTLPDGNYELRIDGTRPFARAERDITIAAADATLDVRFGFVEAKDGYQIVAGDKTLRRQALEQGRRKVTVVDPYGAKRTVDVKVGGGKTSSVP